jgi:hypothetical protein
MEQKCQWDNIIDAPRRKLHALAYAALLATGNRDVIERMPSKEPFEIWSDVLAELKEAYAVAPGDDEEEYVRSYFFMIPKTNAPSYC